ncbi:Uncharacterised protein [Chlamydia abortus]|uniref:Cytochrome c oxidase subunit 2A n=1 Tax=Paenibacillus residui TaxID=629724 RepID=A0ABW3D7M6_9BACL|nr:hypothetical protein [Paenibacillus sp. 32O-W]SHE10803.1 Uncharacterised protein [Chlamydia abortus]
MRQNKPPVDENDPKRINRELLGTLLFLIFAGVVITVAYFWIG